MKVKIYKQLKKFFTLSVKDCIITVLILSATVALCFLLRIFNSSDVYVSMLFILAVFLVSRFTSGYFYGTVSSFVCVLLANYVFTFPYFKFNFTLSGYPLAIICMLVVAITTSALTTQIKEQSKLRLEAEKEKTRSNLLRAVSHDLRTPLTSILGASSAIIDNNDVLTSKERLKLLSEVKEDAQWLIGMVENLLSITRIDGERSAKIIKTSEAVEELISESVMKFKKRFPEQTVSVKVPSELLMVPMDAILIEQVIINLLENAVLHAKTATYIFLSVVKEGDFAVFEVRDDGVGISDDVMPHIFEGYYRQVYEDEGDKKRNMGIGLSVCYTIVKAHNGIMTAENDRNGGAVFKIALPLKEENK